MSLGLTRCVSEAGVKRDGTPLDGNNYSDATWCRFQRGLPRKIGGYRMITPYLTGISRALIEQSQNGNQYYHSGYATGLDNFYIDPNGLASLVQNRTPAGFVSDPANTWQFDVQFNNTGPVTDLFAHAAPNLINPSSGVNRDVFYGNVYDNSAMVTLQSVNPSSTLLLQVSGGVCSLAPYLIIYGNSGYFAWSRPGLPTDFDNVANPTATGATEITAQKIIKGMPLRGGGGFSPAGLFWSVDSVVRANFSGVGGATSTTWQFDQLTTQSSILSANSVIENDGTFYWAGIDRFLMYNGVVGEIPNEMNLNWFYDGINQAYAGKSFAMKVPRYGEIWWCYPRGNATECSHAVIYNYREKTWYDTPLPNTGRGAGLHGDSLTGSVMGGILPTTTGTYNLWRHDVGTNEVNGNAVNSVPSSFTTGYFSGFDMQPPSNASVTIQNLQPDFVQTGPMTVTAIKRNNSNQPEYTGLTYNIFTDTNVSLDQVTPVKETAKQIRLQFLSNVIDGDYQMGKTMMTIGLDGEKNL